MNLSRNKPERDLSELKVRYQVLCYMAVLVLITAGFGLGMLLLMGIGLMFGLDLHKPVGQQRYGVLFVLGLFAAGSVGAHLGSKSVDRVLAITFALFGHIEWSDIDKTARDLDFPPQWLKEPAARTD